MRSMEESMSNITFEYHLAVPCYLEYVPLPLFGTGMQLYLVKVAISRIKLIYVKHVTTTDLIDRNDSLSSYDFMHPLKIINPT
jgi:hypothetical protein